MLTKIIITTIVFISLTYFTSNLFLKIKLYSEQLAFIVVSRLGIEWDGLNKFIKMVIIAPSYTIEAMMYYWLGIGIVDMGVRIFG